MIAAEIIQHFFDVAPVALVVQCTAGKVIHVNREACTLLGYAPGEIADADASKILKIGSTRRSDTSRLPSYTGTFVSFGGKIIQKNGQKVPAEFDVRKIQIKQDEYLVISFRVIQKGVTGDLYPSRSAARKGNSGLWDYDIQRDILCCDRQWYSIMGRDHRKPITTIEEFRSFIHPEDVVSATEVDTTASVLLANKQNYGIEYRIIRADGSIRWVRSSGCVFEDRSGSASRALGYILDITQPQNWG